MIPKTNGNGELSFTPRQILGWIALIGVVASLATQWAFQTAAIDMIDYRLGNIEKDISDSNYVRDEDMKLVISNVDTKLGAIQSDVTDLKKQVDRLEGCDARNVDE